MSTREIIANDRLVKDLKHEVSNHILPFWMALIDEEYGGYYGKVNYDLKIEEKAAKGGIFTARLLWSFSSAYRVLGDEVYLKHAKHAYGFLMNHCMDKENGGIFWMLDHKGCVTDDRKHVYAQAFAIYALSEYYLASHDQEALEQALALFNLIETKGYHSELRSYGEEYTRDWVIKDNEMLSAPSDSVAAITTNTLLHILEAYTTLYTATQNNRVKEALSALVDIFQTRIWNKSTNHMRVFFEKDWTEKSAVKSYGHDIEATWLYDKALNVLGLENDDAYTAFVSEIADNIQFVAMDKEGCMYNEAENGQVDKTRIWWCQAEAMVGFYNMYERTNEVKYLNLVERLWAYTSLHLIDERVGGEWYYSVEPNGEKTERPVVEPWKTPYHSVRACLEIIERGGMRE